MGLLLGTGKFLKNGCKNLYFFNRIDATEQLYKSGKIQYILISGDNSTKNYSEPEDMQAELIKRGIPADKIVLDFAGYMAAFFRQVKIGVLTLTLEKKQ